ncbi:FAD binding domain-containing protein [Russula earlei]|uniref:FAD binding domain-containing protein n=1 Tax=Russula earlei TaxID=71964 RepID=A0ACC0U193_9AGAM|nr:FAD binding domain-containing protein [Russula earlei]
MNRDGPSGQLVRPINSFNSYPYIILYNPPLPAICNPSFTPMTHVDVLILGAGPAGVMCANALVHAGVNVRIIDRRPSRVSAGHADGIQPRTIEVLQSYGLADRLLNEGAIMVMAAFYNPGPNGIECIGRVPDVTAPTARYPYEVTLHQGEIESLFLDSMSKEGLQVERSIVPISLQISEDQKQLADPHAYPVKVVLKHLTRGAGDETETVWAKFVVGADGAHSWVRKTLGISMDGEQTDFVWGVVDIVPSDKTNFPDTRNKSAIHSANGSCMVIPREGDKIRVYVQLSDTDAVDPNTGRVDLVRYGPERLLEVANKTVRPYTIHAAPDDIEWWTIYQIGQRVASRFTAHERVFIAGDACHTHSPKAGQGMNASMNDTHNLAWKLTHVLHGWADISLLKTYEFERRKYAQDLISFDKTFSALFSEKFREDGKGHGPTPEEFIEAFQSYGNFSSGIGIHYAPSVVTRTTHQTAAPNLIIGQRLVPHILVRAADAREVNIQDLAPSDARFKFFVFPGEHMQKVVEHLNRPGCFFNKHRGAFDVVTVLQGRKSTVNYLEVPPVLRPHWSKVLLDDTDVTGTHGGRIYERYGISCSAGALAVVRPDGYVGTIVPLDELIALDMLLCGLHAISVSPIALRPSHRSPSIPRAEQSRVRLQPGYVPRDDIHSSRGSFTIIRCVCYVYVQRISNRLRAADQGEEESDNVQYTFHPIQHNHDTRRADTPGASSGLSTRTRRGPLVTDPAPLPAPASRAAANSRPAAPPTRPTSTPGSVTVTRAVAGAGADFGAPDFAAAAVAVIFLVLMPPPPPPALALATAAGPPLSRRRIVFSFSGARGSLVVPATASTSMSTSATTPPPASKLGFVLPALSFVFALAFAFASASWSSSASRDVRLDDERRRFPAPAALLVVPALRGAGAGVGTEVDGRTGGGSKTGAAGAVNPPGGC